MFSVVSHHQVTHLIRREKRFFNMGNTFDKLEAVFEQHSGLPRWYYTLPEEVKEMLPLHNMRESFLRYADKLELGCLYEEGPRSDLERDPQLIAQARRKLLRAATRAAEETAQESFRTGAEEGRLATLRLIQLELQHLDNLEKMIKQTRDQKIIGVEAGDVCCSGPMVDKESTPSACNRASHMDAPTAASGTIAAAGDVLQSTSPPLTVKVVAQASEGAGGQARSTGEASDGLCVAAAEHSTASSSTAKTSSAGCTSLKKTFSEETISVSELVALVEASSKHTASAIVFNLERMGLFVDTSGFDMDRSEEAHMRRLFQAILRGNTNKKSQFKELWMKVLDMAEACARLKRSNRELVDQLKDIPRLRRERLIGRTEIFQRRIAQILEEQG